MKKKTKIADTLGSEQIANKTEELLVTKPTFRQRYLKAKYFLLIISLAFAVLFLLARNYPYFPFDVIITQTIQEFDPPWFDSLMRGISQAGNMMEGIVSTVLIGVLLLVAKRFKESFMVFVSTTGAYALVETAKSIVHRPRPSTDLIDQVGHFFRSDSFPSGHVMYYMGLYGFLLFLAFSELKKGWLRTILIIVLSALLLLIGLSRIYLGAHWFSDVLGAYLLGTLWLSLMAAILHRIGQKQTGKEV